MADLTVIQKGSFVKPNGEMGAISPPVPFIKFANWGEVSGATFAKGVITDFQVVSTDPFQVASMVKVAPWDDWIPLFYRPKAQYWDDEEHLATVFNDSEKYYEKAWMSFRVGDEVSVMLLDGVPKAVVGFTNGMPRVGEDILKFSVGGDFYYQCSKLIDPNTIDASYPGPDGPDGLNLGLTEECWGFYSSGEIYQPDPTPLHDNYHEIWKNWWILMPVGPILYLIDFAYNESWNDVSHPDHIKIAHMGGLYENIYTLELYNKIKADIQMPGNVGWPDIYANMYGSVVYGGWRVDGQTVALENLKVYVRPH